MLQTCESLVNPSIQVLVQTFSRLNQWVEPSVFISAQHSRRTPTASLCTISWRERQVIRGQTADWVGGVHVNCFFTLYFKKNCLQKSRCIRWLYVAFKSSYKFFDFSVAWGTTPWKTKKNEEDDISFSKINIIKTNVLAFARVSCNLELNFPLKQRLKTLEEIDCLPSL